MPLPSHFEQICYLSVFQIENCWAEFMSLDFFVKHAMIACD